MASLRDLLRQLGSGVQALRKPLPPPVDVISNLSRQQLTPRVQAARRQSLPLVNQARTAFQAARPSQVLPAQVRRGAQKVYQNQVRPFSQTVQQSMAGQKPQDLSSFQSIADFSPMGAAAGTVRRASSKFVRRPVTTSKPVRIFQRANLPKRLPQDDVGAMRDFMDLIRDKAFKPDPKLRQQIELDARRLAERYELGRELSNTQLANKFAKVVDAGGELPKSVRKTAGKYVKDVRGKFRGSTAAKAVPRTEDLYGGVAGIEYDKETGEISFDPQKAVLGVAGMAVAGRIKNVGKGKKKPKIDRTKLTGRALNYTNDELLSGKIRPRSQTGSQTERLPKSPADISAASQVPSRQILDGPTGGIRPGSIRAGQTGRQAASVPGSREGIPRQSLGTSPYDNAVKLARGQVVDISPAVTRKREQLIKELQTEVFDPVKEVAAKQKKNVVDRFRTPADVYEKFGQGKAAEALRLSEIQAKREIETHITQIQDWVRRAGRRQEQVFDVLDGKAVPLTPDEQKIVTEIRGYFSAWAQRLGLPEEKQITSYITHIFEPDLIKKEFDPDLAKLITGKVPGSVYDPFLQKRYGIEGYKKDLGLALQAYAKRGVRKANFDPVLAVLKERTKKMELSQVDFIRRNLERINLRPTQMDNEIDSFIKSTPISYRLGQRPTMRLTQALRSVGYRGALGGNIGSAVRNLTQGVNTYSQLGEKYTMLGYARALRPGSRKELEQVGVLANSFIDDTNISVYKSLLRRLDSVLFYAFEKAEQINRGAAYFGAKQRALHAGKSADEAVLEGLNMARKTQFTFGNVDTPEILSSDIAKTFGQFQSFNLKQTEFLAKMIKNREYAGMLRWIAANAVIAGTVGKLIGYDTSDIIPFSSVATGQTKLGQTPAIGAITSVGAAGYNTAAVAMGREAPFNDKFGQPIGADEAFDALVPIIPGGVQAKKTIQGLSAASEGASTSDAGRVRYPVRNDALSTLRAAVFGQYSGPMARFYFDNALTPLGDKDSLKYQQLVESGADPVQVWKYLYKQRTVSSLNDKVTEIKKDKTLTITDKQQQIQEAINEARRIMQGIERF